MAILRTIWLKIPCFVLSVIALMKLWLRIHWSLLRVLQSNVLWYAKVYIYWKFIQYILHGYKTQILKKFSLDKINVTKNALFFFRELQLIRVLLLICESYMSWSTSFVSVKLCLGFFIFDFVSFLLKFIFLFNKEHGLLHFEKS